VGINEEDGWLVSLVVPAAQAEGQKLAVETETDNQRKHPPSPLPPTPRKEGEGREGEGMVIASSEFPGNNSHTTVPQRHEAHHPKHRQKTDGCVVDELPVKTPCPFAGFSSFIMI